MLHTGGIVALGVFHQGISPAECTRKFHSFAKQAFSLRSGLENPVLKTLFQPFCSYLYKSEGIDKALQGQFGFEPYLFGPSTTVPIADSDAQSRTGATDGIKVGVVTCPEGINQPRLVANYSRGSSDKSGEFPWYAGDASPLMLGERLFCS